MTETEQQRLDEALERSEKSADGEHVDFTWRDTDTYQSCRKCCHIKPRTGWTKPCRGWARISLRETAK